MVGLSTVKIFDIDKPKVSLSNWQIAVGLGVGGVIGLGVWYYFNSKRQSKTVSTETVSQQNGSVDIKKVTQTTTETAKIPPKKEDNGVKEAPKTPLQRAEQIKGAGNDFFKKGEYMDAIRCYSEAIDLCPVMETNTLATYYQNRAACYDHLNKLEEVVKDCAAALKLNPKYTKALSRKAKAHQTLGQLTQCLEDVTAVCILENFMNQKSLEMADTVLKDLGKQHAKEVMKNKEPVQPSPYFVKAYFTSFPNDPVISASDFEAVEINTQFEDSTRSHIERAKQLLVRGRYDDVIPACTEAVRAGEGLEPEALLLRATMYLLRGQHSLALDDLNTIITSEVQNKKITINALIKRASLYLQSDEKEKTFADFATAEALDPDNPDLYLHRGQVNLLTDNVEQSLADFKKCVSLDPNFAIGVMQGHYAEYRRAVQGQSSTGIAKVIEKFKRDTRKFPKCTEASILLAQVLMDQQQYDEADKYFQSAMDMDPSNATLRVHRGLLYLQWKGDIDAAIKFINEGIQVDDRCSFCYETLGTIEVQRGNLKRAVELFNKAIPLSKTELELAHIFSLRDAAEAQQAVVEKLGLQNQIGT